MKLTLTRFLALDGVCQGPGSPEDYTGDGFTRGGWFVPYLDEAFEQPATTRLGQADALLLGRRTYVSFARDWPKTTEPPSGPLMNSLPKCAASHSLTEAGWSPTAILSGDVPARVADLKRQPGRELQLHGSARPDRSRPA
ncbi:dihydrofolate reductase family protein [Streptomyces sp. NPDC055186]